MAPTIRKMDLSAFSSTVPPLRDRTVPLLPLSERCARFINDGDDDDDDGGGGGGDGDGDDEEDEDDDEEEDGGGAAAAPAPGSAGRGGAVTSGRPPGLTARNGSAPHLRTTSSTS